MTLAQQRDHESGDGRVLTDDGLGHLRAEGDQRVAGAAFRWAAAHRLVVSFVLLFQPVELVSKTHQGGVGTAAAPYPPLAIEPGVRATPQTAAGSSPVRAATAATSASGGGVRFQMHERGQPGAAAVAQRGGRGVARPRRGVEPGAAEHRLGGPDHHRQRLGDHRSEPASPPEPDHEQRDPDLQHRPGHGLGQQAGQGRSAGGRGARCTR